MSNQWSFPGWGSRNGKSDDAPMANALVRADEDAVAADPIEALAAAALASQAQASEGQASESPSALRQSRMSPSWQRRPTPARPRRSPRPSSRS